jgi:hypothetical protein
MNICLKVDTSLNTDLCFLGNVTGQSQVLYTVPEATVLNMLQIESCQLKRIE